MTARYRARVKRAEPLVIREVDGSSVTVPCGWNYIVNDLERRPSKQAVFVGVRASQLEALEAACERIKKLAEVGC